MCIRSVGAAHMHPDGMDLTARQPRSTTGAGHVAKKQGNGLGEQESLHSRSPCRNLVVFRKEIAD